MKRKDIET